MAIILALRQIMLVVVGKSQRVSSHKSQKNAEDPKQRHQTGTSHRNLFTIMVNTLRCLLIRKNGDKL